MPSQVLCLHTFVTKMLSLPNSFKLDAIHCVDGEGTSAEMMRSVDQQSVIHSPQSFSPHLGHHS